MKQRCCSKVILTTALLFIVMTFIGGCPAGHSSIKNLNRKSDMNTATISSKTGSTKRVTPSLKTPSVICKSRKHPLSADGYIHESDWLSANEILFNSRSTDGQIDAPRTYVRFLHDHTTLYFHVEVEELDSDDIVIDSTELWKGSNIEFLISPHWYEKPYYEEYEFLFNKPGASNTLYWQNCCTLQEAINWKPDNFNWRTSEKGTLHFHPDIIGWVIEGKISFASLNISPPKKEDFWGIGLFRKYCTANETKFLAWSPTLVSPPAFHVPNKFGKIIFD